MDRLVLVIPAILLVLLVGGLVRWWLLRWELAVGLGAFFAAVLTALYLWRWPGPIEAWMIILIFILLILLAGVIYFLEAAGWAWTIIATLIVALIIASLLGFRWPSSVVSAPKGVGQAPAGPAPSAILGCDADTYLNRDAGVNAPVTIEEDHIAVIDVWNVNQQQSVVTLGPGTFNPVNEGVMISDEWHYPTSACTEADVQQAASDHAALLTKLKNTEDNPILVSDAGNYFRPA